MPQPTPRDFPHKGNLLCFCRISPQGCPVACDLSLLSPPGVLANEFQSQKSVINIPQRSPEEVQDRIKEGSGLITISKAFGGCEALAVASSQPRMWGRRGCPHLPARAQRTLFTVPSGGLMGGALGFLGESSSIPVTSSSPFEASRTVSSKILSASRKAGLGSPESAPGQGLLEDGFWRRWLLGGWFL